MKKEEGSFILLTFLRKIYKKRDLGVGAGFKYFEFCFGTCIIQATTMELGVKVLSTIKTCVHLYPRIFEAWETILVHSTSGTWQLL